MSILRKATKLTDAGALVFGRPASGKSTVVVNKLKGKEVLWLYTGNANALVNNKSAENFYVGEINDVEDLDSVLAQLKAGEIKVDYVVLDGIEGLRDLTLSEVASKSKGDNATQQDWAVATGIVGTKLRELRKLTGTLYGIVNVVEDIDSNSVFKGWKIALNPMATALVMQMFGEKVLTFTSGEKDKDGNLTVKYNTVTGERAVLLRDLPSKP